MQTSMNFSSLQASLTTISMSAMKEEITDNKANAIPQLQEEESSKASTIGSFSDIHTSLTELQKNIMTKTLATLSQIQEDILKTWEEIFQNKANGGQKGQMFDWLGKTSSDIGGGVSITQGFLTSLEVSFKGKITGNDGITKELEVNVSLSQSFLEHIQLNSSSGKDKSTVEKIIDPLVIDYDGSGTELDDMKFAFDLDSDGTKDQISMLKKGSGFLALDKNHDGKINNGSELFGTKSGDGFKDLSAYDSNRDGKIDKDDPIYEQLRIWIPNQKGEGELVGLGEKGIGAIYLNAKERQESLYGKQGDLLGIKQKSADVVRTDGSYTMAHHVDFVARQMPNNPLSHSQSKIAKLYGQYANSQQEQISSINLTNLSLYSLNAGTNGVSSELSLMWKKLEENFEKITHFDFSNQARKDEGLKPFDEEHYENMNKFLFDGFDQDIFNFSSFFSSASMRLNKLLAA